MTNIQCRNIPNLTGAGRVKQFSGLLVTLGCTATVALLQGPPIGHLRRESVKDQVTCNEPTTYARCRLRVSERASV